MDLPGRVPGWGRVQGPRVLCGASFSREWSPCPPGACQVGRGGWVGALDLAEPRHASPAPTCRGQQFAQQMQQQNPELIEQLRSQIRSRTPSASNDDQQE